jgi:lipopolysaccharide export system protein LptA
MNSAFAFFLVLLLGAPTLAHAQPIDLSSGGPVAVTAAGGFEWHESEQTITATGSARAVRGDVTVLADTLIAHYRRKSDGQSAAPAPTPAAGGEIESSTGGNEVYRLKASGHVRIVTPTDEADGDEAVYDIDQAVLVMTGKHLRLTTPQYVMTARDSLEYWSQKHMAVGRGNAVVVSADGRRLSADTLVGYTSGAEGTAPSQPASSAAAASSTQAGGKLERMEAYGNVEVRTQIDTVRGDRGVYLPDTGQAQVFGNVKIFHEQSVVTGSAADVNMKTGIGHVVAAPSGRVQGVIVPSDAQKPDRQPPLPAKEGPPR